MGEPFIGMGKAPDGVDLPLGLSMGLSMHPEAAETFGKMNAEEKEAAIRYVQSSVKGEEAELRVKSAIRQLADGRTRFF